MENKVIAAAEYNAEFTMDVMLRAAELVGDPREIPEGGNPFVEVLLKAWGQLQQRETARQRKLRTYEWRHLTDDLRSYILLNEGVNPDSLVPISEWAQAHGPVAMAGKLWEATPIIARMAEERTTAASRIGIMSRKELDEHFLMEGAAGFLRGQGLHVEMSREWEDPNAPLDYRGTVDRVSWAFELTQLREDPKRGCHRKIGHPKDRRTLEEQLKAFEEEPMPKVPRGPEALRKNLNQAIGHGRKESKTKTLMGAKYCLVIHNQQFTNPEDWEKITIPELGEIDAAIFFHDQLVPPGQVWEVIPADCFGMTVESGTVEDLETIAFASYRSGVSQEADIPEIDLGFFFEP